jgi:hypothetical protein
MRELIEDLSHARGQAVIATIIPWKGRLGVSHLWQRRRGGGPIDPREDRLVAMSSTRNTIAHLSDNSPVCDALY